MKDNFEVKEQVVMVPIGRLLDNPLNEYLRGDSITPESVEGLVVSIKENGVNVPLLVTPFRQAFRIVWGHRRRFAAKLAGLVEVPCIIRELSEDEQFTRMLNENIQRANITALAEARCYRRLEEEGNSLPAIERKTGVGKGRIKNLLTILTLEPEVQDLFEREKLAQACAPILAKLTDRDSQIAVARDAATRGWSAAKLQRKVDDWVPVDGAIFKGGKKERAGTTRRGSLFDDEGGRVTKSEALALFGEGETFSVRDLKRAILGSCCNECDEKNFPNICRECPVSQMLATLLDAKGVKRPKAAEGKADGDTSARRVEEPATRAA